MFERRLKIIGARLVYYRKLKGWTQLELATACGLSEDYISAIENGKALGLTVLTVMKITEALGIEMGKVVEGEE